MAEMQRVLVAKSRLIIVLIGLLSSTAWADLRAVTTKIADTTTSIPGSSETFQDFFSRSLDYGPAISGHQVVFSNSNPGQIYFPGPADGFSRCGR